MASRIGAARKEKTVNVRMIGMDLGVTSKTEIAVAEGADVTKTFRASSTPAGLTSAVKKAAAGGEGEVGLVLESTAMAWFVAGVAAERSGVRHKLYRVSGRKAAALRAFYRTHTKTDRIDARVLARIPLVDDTSSIQLTRTALQIARHT